jgi:GT2 family glycosyltransferase
MTDLGIIILNYYSSQETIELYKSLISHEYRIVHQHIIVVDNSCDKRQETELKKIVTPSQLIISKKNDGYAAGNNRGIRHLINQADFDYFLILNPDISFDPAIIESLLGHFQRNSKLAAVGPRIVNRDDLEKVYSDGGILYPLNGVLHPSHKNYGKSTSEFSETKLISTDYVHGAFLLVSLMALNKVGLISEDYFLYFEEVDWCQKAKEAGLDIMVDSNMIAIQTMSSQNETYMYFFTRSHIIFNKKFNSKSWKKTIRFYLSNIRTRLRQKEFRISIAIFLGLVNGLVFRNKHSSK